MMYLFKDITEPVLSGEKDALPAYAELKEIEKHLKAAIEEIQPYALEESEKYGKSFELNGYKFERRNGKANYSFKHIHQYQEAENFLKFIKQQSMAALKAAENGGVVVDADGQVINPPNVTYSKDVLICKEI